MFVFQILFSDCQKYTYDKTWYESTVSSENNWVCDKELNVANIFAYMRIGELIGSIIFGWFGDKYVLFLKFKSYNYVTGLITATTVAAIYYK